MRARYDGECVVCDGAIFADRDEIVRKDRGWAHDGCVTPTQGDFLGSDVVCGICNLAMPCWCPPAVQDPQRAAHEALERAKRNAARDPFEGFL